MLLLLLLLLLLWITVDVVVEDDDTYIWVYWSSDHLFQVYYKVRQGLIQNATGITKFYNFITKCDWTRPPDKQGTRLSRLLLLIGFFPDLFVHNNWNISHQTQSSHLSNTILKCLYKRILILPGSWISGLFAHDGCEIKRNCSTIPVPQVSWWVNLFLTVDNVLLFLQKYHRPVSINN